MTENMKSTGESIVVALNELHPFPNHPFKVEQDEAFDALVESICNHGVLHRIIIRPRELGGYEIVAGHRRVEACRKLGLLVSDVILIYNRTVIERRWQYAHWRENSDAEKGGKADAE